MSQFDFWQRWGAGLSDTQFANAWAALGVVWSRDGERPRKALERSIQQDARDQLPWRFPPESEPDLIRGTTPLEWAEAWSQVLGSRQISLVVVEFPVDEPVPPWLRLLSETSPPTTEVIVAYAQSAPAMAAPPEHDPVGAEPPEAAPAAPAPEALPPVTPRPRARTAGRAEAVNWRTSPTFPKPASEPPVTDARFLQQKSFVEKQGQFNEAANGFIAGVKTQVRVRIGTPDASWNALATAFPVHALPQDQDSWPLQVWLTEAAHLDEPQVRDIKLPRLGNSDEAEFEFVPRGDNPSFEGRLTVMHDGRVIQTAVLRASVQPDAAQLAPGNAPRLEDFIPVRQSIGDLRNRLHFDLAFVLNNTAAGRPLAVGLADKHAWLSDLSQAKAIAEDISVRLAPVAKSAADYADGVTGKKGLALLIQLAQAGSLLNEFLVNQQINANGNRPEIARAEYLQVVSTKLDAVIPFEFIFDHAAPEDDAKLCPKWRDGIANGKCANTCDRTTGKHVCPMGFWGLQKVIERHALSPELAATGRELFLQSEASARRPALALGGVSVFGASDRVKEPALSKLAKAIKDSAGEEADQAKDWDEWMKAVERRSPRLLIALAHNDGKGFNATLEIGGKALKSVLLRETHLRAKAEDPPPLVALLGCDTVGTADDYGNHAAMFRSKGAAIVIATIATVLGEHAAQVGQSLVKGLLSGSGAEPLRVGELLRAIKRKALLDHQMMALCLVAYGDADWQIKHH